MIAELGHYALVLALGLGLIQSVAPVIGAQTRDGALMRLADSTALMQFFFSPVLGVLSDRHGRRPVILLSDVGLLGGAGL